MKTCTPPYPAPTFTIPLILILITINFQTTFAYSYSTGPTVFRRQSSCGSGPSTLCGVKNYCCPSDHQCIPVDNKTSVVCCKLGQFCDQIKPIPCENTPSPTRSVGATPVSKVIRCGSLCCPSGYECGRGEDRCLMKPEDMPEDHRRHRREQDEKDKEACRQLLGRDRAKGKGKAPSDIFSAKAVSVGFFPGVALGLAIMYGYIKIVEMKARRRTINFNNPSPDDMSWAERRSNMEQHESIAIGYSPHLDHPGSRNISPSNWKPITPADFSPNLGPKIPPRERSTSGDRVESRVANSRTTPAQQTPSPHPLAAPPVEPRAQSAPRSSTDSETDHSESFLSSAISNTHSSSTRDLPPPGQASNQVRHFSSEVASVITDAGPAFSDMGLDSRIMIETERGREGRGVSTETGYSDSIYRDGSSVLQPFAFEDEVPPLHVSSPQSPFSPMREQNPFASPFNPKSPATKSPFEGETPPSRFGGF